jgi:alpha-beta hydrolase superfamily lysophospholipase
MTRSMDLIWLELGERIHFGRDVSAVDVPVHLFAGDRDRITDLALIRSWFDGLRAPSKRLDVVAGAGHLNLFEAPDRFVAFMAAIRRDLPD